MNGQLRIRAFTYSDFSGYQILQERRWWGWKTIDQEKVPAHVRICAATCGDTGGWKSKFHDVPAWHNPLFKNATIRGCVVVRLFASIILAGLMIGSVLVYTHALDDDGKGPLRGWSCCR